MAQVISPRLNQEAQRAQRRGRVGLWSCSVHMLTRKPVNHKPGKPQSAECPHTESVFERYTGTPPSHFTEYADPAHGPYMFIM